MGPAIGRKAKEKTRHAVSHVPVYTVVSMANSPFYFALSSSTRWRFYPQRPSGQAVVTGINIVFPSPPRSV